jgi:1,4-dihydroxy-2-naphthoyl-CoA hydrolase
MDLRMATSIEDLNAHSKNSAADKLGIQVKEIGEYWLAASMPLDRRTSGFDGKFALGALSMLAETVGSLAATVSVDPSIFVCVGQTLQVYQLKSTAAGPVLAKATALELDDQYHLWSIDIRDGNEVLIANATLRIAVLQKDGSPLSAPV